MTKTSRFIDMVALAITLKIGGILMIVAAFFFGDAPAGPALIGFGTIGALAETLLPKLAASRLAAVPGLGRPLVHAALAVGTIVHQDMPAVAARPMGLRQARSLFHHVCRLSGYAHATPGRSGYDERRFADIATRTLHARFGDTVTDGVAVGDTCPAVRLYGRAEPHAFEQRLGVDRETAIVLSRLAADEDENTFELLRVARELAGTTTQPVAA